MRFADVAVRTFFLFMGVVFVVIALDDEGEVAELTWLILGAAFLAVFVVMTPTKDTRP